MILWSPTFPNQNPTRAKGLLYIYMTSLHEKVAWISHEQITWLSHGQSCEFTWHKVSWLKKKKFKFWSQIFDILEKQSIGYCIRLINRTLSVWNMTVKNGEKKNTHETGRLTLRQMFSTAWFKNTFNWPAIHCILLEISVVIHALAFAVLFNATKKKSNHQKAVKL